MPRRLLLSCFLTTALIVPRVACAQASTSTARTAPAAAKPQSAFAHLVDPSLNETAGENADPRKGAALIRSIAARAAEIVHVKGKSRYSDAPLPDDDINAPVDPIDNDAYVRPDFFQQQTGQSEDANVHDRASQTRKGHGGVSGGLALAVPIP